MYKMKELSLKQKYEEAAEIRDTVNLILEQLHKSSILAEPVNKANVLIKIEGNAGIDYILLLEGKVYLKNNIVDDNDNFDTAIEDYFAGSIKLDHALNERDLEQIKILLSWLVKNKEKVKVYYLKEFTDTVNLFTSMQRI